jgi:hypothetical protein
LQLTGVPGKLSGNQPFHVGIDGEPRDAEGTGGKHQKRAGGNDAPPIVRAEIDNPDNR